MVSVRPNSLGDLRAEADGPMLDRAFVETADYRSLIETSDRIIVVGRRGTGKSALAGRIGRHFSQADACSVTRVSPEEHQTIGLRPLVGLFGDTFNLSRAGARIIWRYAMCMEVGLSVKSYHLNDQAFDTIGPVLKQWSQLRGDTFDKIKEILNQVINREANPEERVGALSQSLNLKEVENEVASLLELSGQTCVFVIDSLDEGYQPDNVGIGIVDGLIQGSIDIKTRMPGVRPILFLRDNIFRAVQERDQDYARNIEGSLLRLHWDEQALLEFAAKRLKIAKEVEQESSEKIWNQCVHGDLKGRKGFGRCLRLTLYRPRDLLSLLNNSFYLASKENQELIVLEHLQKTAEEISNNRLEDLRKEYSWILPGLDRYISVFRDVSPEFEVTVLQDALTNLLQSGSNDPLVQQDFLILQDAKSILQGLYSIGFVGVKEETSGNFSFCHDGRSSDREFKRNDKVLAHPCYWIALNSTRETLDVDEAEEIFDEYDNIHMVSETPEIRAKKIDELVRRLRNIPHGHDGSSDFEEWCKEAISICFVKGLINVELKANKNATTRRDVVGTNLGEEGVWKRIYDDYGSRQVTFEVKNYEKLEASDYQQISFYLKDDYGRIGFVVTRDNSLEVTKDRDLGWIRDIYGSSEKKLIVKLNAKFLAKLLVKLKRPQKHDSVDHSLHKLLDTYTRLYVAGQKGEAA